jgi:hypothetical protein
MKKIFLIICIYFLSLNFLNAEEKKNCKEFKKFSKEYFKCKTNNLKKNIKEFSFTEDIKIDGKSIKELTKK